MEKSNDSYTIKKGTVDNVVVFIAALIPDLLVAYVGMKFIEDTWKTFWYILLAMAAFQFVMWLSRELVNYLLFIAYTKKRFIEIIYNDLVTYKFPTTGYYPDGYNSDIYYYEITTDSDASCRLKMKSLCFYNEFNAVGTTMLGRMRLHKVHSEAIGKYFKDYPDISIYNEEQ